MPQITKYSYRLYCKKCEEFTLHTKEQEDSEKSSAICECGTVYTTVSMALIDPDKISLQQDRYKKQKFSRFADYTNALIGTSNPYTDMFKSPSASDYITHEIIESDAGWEAKSKKISEEKEEIKKERMKELFKFKGVNRNDICLCGSNLKYKKCCHIQHKEYSRYFRN